MGVVINRRELTSVWDSERAEWGFEWEVADERRREFSAADGFFAADEMCLSPSMGLPMGFLMSALVLGWGLYVWLWECSEVSADGFFDVYTFLRLGFLCLGVRVFWSRGTEVVKYNRKSSSRNSISTWLHVEKSPCSKPVSLASLLERMVGGYPLGLPSGTRR